MTLKATGLENKVLKPGSVYMAGGVYFKTLLGIPLT